ncbi:hypothetical protein ANOM_000244 [Aspergillus nomiae NRRL 13137]|uniref:Uncharacterized protein n=1 Tax=Aspergillus nomiae NRRL (strain ATCC 15546 / NRRL 13137 / CBS 260.88 / M93) TaxID=1509407 RepID=A0A0L1JIQ0_ASPN3|nr:uncharacterized protein ANOM_000244 [Aspergillus nomiae NRRL 13137]KNG91626.1 hypothetical protein ANOM_000244 [Aspergillus nomiae NRRL 13137]
MTEVIYIAPLASSPHQITEVPSAMSGAFQDSTTARYFRAGGPNLCEAPYNYRSLPSEHIPHGDVKRILYNRNIRFLTTSFVECTPSYDDIAEPTQALQVLAHRPENDTRENWQHAAREIQALLRNHDLDNITVDIIDWCFAQGPPIYPCKSSDAIFPKWDAVRNRILQVVVDVSGFQLLGCYRIGYDCDAENSTPSVLVTVDPKHKRDWSIVEKDIRDILNGFDLHMVDVRIFKDRDIFCASRSSAGRQSICPIPPPVEDECPMAVTIGSDLGAHNSERYGTFGGWLDLQQKSGSEWQQFGVTCRHCVLGHAFKGLRIFEKKDEALNHMEVMAEDPNNSTPHATESPSPGKVDYEKHGGVPRSGGDGSGSEPPRGSSKKWECLRERLSRLENHLAELEAYKRANSYEFGEVWADSGDDTRSTTTIMDWALLKPHPSRAFPFNEFRSFKALGRYQPIGSTGYIQAGIELSNEQQLAKYGFQTGVTRGKYNELATTVFTVSKTGEIRTTEEHSILYQPNITSFEPGDSGSLVYDTSGCIAGLAFGAQMSGRIVVFTHIDSLIADIKGQTGAEQVIFYGQKQPTEAYDEDLS